MGPAGGPIHPGEWGACTYKDNVIYLHVLDWSKFPAWIHVSGQVVSASVLGGGYAGRDRDHLHQGRRSRQDRTRDGGEVGDGEAAVTIRKHQEDAALSTDDVRIVEITSVDDPLLLPWLDLYEVSFPPQERVLVSDHLRVLIEKANGRARDAYLLAAVNEAGDLIGMIRYHLASDCRVAHLWYLAVVPDMRSKGIGAICYNEVRDRARQAGMRAMLFEVDIPVLPGTEEAEAPARRRIAFYQRQGAYLLGGIGYMQSIGPHQAPVPMHIMVHPFEPIDSKEAFELAKALFGESVQQSGVLSLE